MCVFVSISANDSEINQPKPEVLSCPKCGQNKVHFNAASKSPFVEPDFFISCDSCNHQGSLEKSIQEALGKWHRPKDLLVARLEQLIKKWGGKYSAMPMPLNAREMGV